MHNTLFLNRFY